jgi:hypothetical protein
MFGGLMARLVRAVTTKAGIVLIGAVLLGAGGAAMAMASAHGQIGANVSGPGASASPTKHAGDQDEQNEQDDTACTSTGTPSSTATTHGGGDAVQGPQATPTKAARDDDANEHEGTEHDGTECEGDDDHSPTGTHTPEPTERPEGTHTPQASPTKGPGD